MCWGGKRKRWFCRGVGSVSSVPLKSSSFCVKPTDTSLAETETREQRNGVKGQSKQCKSAVKVQRGVSGGLITSQRKTNIAKLSQHANSRLGRVIIVSLSFKPLQKTWYLRTRWMRQQTRRAAFLPQTLSVDLLRNASMLSPASAHMHFTFVQTFHQTASFWVSWLQHVWTNFSRASWDETFFSGVTA